MINRILAIMLLMTVLTTGQLMAQDELEGKVADPVGDLGYQTYTVELPRRAWTIGITLLDANGEASELSVKLVDGHTAEAISSRTRGLLQENGTVRMCDAYGYYIWFVPDSELEEWRSTPSVPRYTGPDGVEVLSGTADDLATHPGGGRPGVEDTARRDLLLEHSEKITVGDLHIFIYAPGYSRADLSIDKVDYTHIVNGVFPSDEDVLDVEDIPFELSNLETPSHIADIVMILETEDLGFITAEGEQIPYDYWAKQAEDVKEVREVEEVKEVK